MKKVVAIRHVPFEDLGYFAPIFEDRGYRVSYVDAGKDDIASIHDPNILVICGGPISVNDENLYPFLHDEFKLVESRLQQDKPVLGLCLGAQVMAKVLGSKVYPAKAKEIGWATVDLTEKHAVLRFLEDVKVLHWHGETFDLPKNSTRLASTAICENQAFKYGKSLGIQFHPEVTAPNLEQWYIGHTGELLQNQVDINQLRKDGKKYAPLLQKKGSQFINAWIDEL